MGITGFWEYGFGIFWLDIWHMGITGFWEYGFGSFWLDIWAPSWRNGSID